jgi:AraC-like DNA-binding protein
MSLEVASVELGRPQRSLPEWTEALSTCVGRVLPEQRDEEDVSCVATTNQLFSGRVEFGAIGDAILAKLSATPYLFKRSLLTATPTLPVPVLLFFQICGSSRVSEDDRSDTIYPGDWCLLDTLNPYSGRVLGNHSEVLLFGLERPTDPELIDLLQRGVARRWDGKTGLSRVLQSTVIETFNQLSGLGPSGGKSLQKAVTTMAWGAVREQINTRPKITHKDLQCSKLKSYIEARLADPELSIEQIAHGCDISVRSVHRVFEDDPAGSVTKYVWLRRLNQCAADLRDPEQAHRPITEICLSWGFESTSHFSRLFRGHFGIPPRAYRLLSAA